jgi:hypothetical protein
LGFAAMATFLMAAALAAAQGSGPTLRFTKGGKPDVNAQLNFVFKTGPKGTTATGSDGAASIPRNILTANKPHTHMNVYQCPDGTLYAVEDGAEGRIPCPEKKRRKLGGFYLDDSGTIEINEDLGTPVVSLPQNPLVSFQVGGGVGFKNLGGTSGQQAAFRQAFPGSTFSTSANTFAGEVGTSMNIGPLVVASNLWRASANTSNGSGPLQGGGTDTAEIIQQFQGISVTGGGRIPLGSKASFIVHGGGNFWHANIDTKETVASGTTSTTVANSRGVDGRGWMAGAALQVKVSRRWSVVMRYDYLPMANGPVNVHLHDGSVGVVFRLFGPPGR